MHLEWENDGWNCVLKLALLLKVILNRSIFSIVHAVNGSRAIHILASCIFWPARICPGGDVQYRQRGRRGPYFYENCKPVYFRVHSGLLFMPVWITR